MFDTERASAPAWTGGCPCMGVGPAFTYTSNDNKHITHYHTLKGTDLTSCDVILLQKIHVSTSITWTLQKLVANSRCSTDTRHALRICFCFYDATTLYIFQNNIQYYIPR